MGVQGRPTTSAATPGRGHSATMSVASRHWLARLFDINLAN
jgi:hypothetical protein